MHAATRRAGSSIVPTTRRDHCQRLALYHQVTSLSSHRRDRGSSSRWMRCVRASGRPRDPDHPGSDAPVPGPGARAGTATVYDLTQRLGNASVHRHHRHIRLSPQATGLASVQHGRCRYQSPRTCSAPQGNRWAECSARLDGGYTSTSTTRPAPQGGKINRIACHRQIRRSRRRRKPAIGTPCVAPRSPEADRLAGDLAHRESRRRRLAANHVPLLDPCVSTRTFPPNGAAGGQRHMTAQLEPI